MRFLYISFGLAYTLYCPNSMSENIPISSQAKVVPVTGSLPSPVRAYKCVFVKQNVYFFLCGITIEISLISNCTPSSTEAALFIFDVEVWPFVFPLLTAISSSSFRFFVAGSSGDGSNEQTCWEMVLNNSTYGGEANLHSNQYIIYIHTHLPCLVKNM